VICAPSTSFPVWKIDVPFASEEFALDPQAVVAIRSSAIDKA